MERLIAQFRALIEKTDTQLVRYLHSKINWENRIIAILGARGVGAHSGDIVPVIPEHTVPLFS